MHHLRWLALLLAVGFSLPAQATDGRVQLDAFFDDLVTLKADFSQRIINFDAGSALSSDGVFYLQRPGLFRWEYREPPQLVVADGDRVWLYDQDLEQISHQGQERALRGTPAQLLIDTAPLEDYFSLQEIERDGGLGWVELRPLQAGSEFERILLGFADNLLRELEMLDSFGQVTRFRFDGLERNTGLDAALFRFRPPPGIDVLGTD